MILVGEIRDKETASVALRASMTGHLVLSTLHTNTSLGAINRLKDLGIDPYLIGSSLNCVIAQRLLKKLCDNCKDTSINLGALNSNKIIKFSGCSNCDQTGLQGRIAIFDYLKINNNLKSKISNNEFLTDANLAKQSLLQTEAEKLVSNKIVPKFEAVRMSLNTNEK